MTLPGVGVPYDSDSCAYHHSIEMLQFTLHELLSETTQKVGLVQNTAATQHSPCAAGITLIVSKFHGTIK